MRLAHLSDTHVADSRRPEDTRQVLEAFVTQAREAEVDLIVHTGDFFDAESSESERALVREFLVAAAEVAPVVGIRGNHDHALDDDLFSGQRAPHAVRLFSRPGTIGMTIGASVICIPWFTRAGIAARLPAGTSMDQITFAVNQAAATLLRQVEAEAQRIREARMIPILLHHGEVIGWRKSSTGYQPRGITVAYGADQLLETGAEYVALGHIHDGEANVWHDGRVAYAGSTERTDFGETERKGWRLVTFEGGKFVRNEFVELPARRIELIEEDWTAGPGPMHSFTHGVKGSIVRFRYRVRAQDAHLVDEDAIRQALLDAGAHEIKVEAVVDAEARVRCPEITAAESLWDEVVAWLGATGKRLEPDELERLRLRLAEIEAPAAREEAAA